MERQKLLKILFGISGFVPLLFLLNKDTTLLIYSLFVLIYFSRHFIKLFFRYSPLPTFLILFLTITIFGLISESLYWLSNSLSGSKDPTVNLIIFTHISSFFGFYVAIGLSWALILQFFRFSLLQVFLAQGIIGFLIEQQGAVFLQMITNPLAIIWLFYVAPVYASYVAIGYLFAQDRIDMKSKKDHFLKYILIFLLQLTFMFLFSVLFK